MFFKLYKWCQIAQRITYLLVNSFMDVADFNLLAIDVSIM